MANVENLLSRLSGVRKTGNGQWIARCCAHEDNSPSLTIAERDDGRVLLHCFAGCETADVLAAVGLELKDVMPDNVGYHRRKPDRRPFNALDVLAAVKTDLMTALIVCKDIQRGKVLDENESLAMARIVGRITMAVSLAGGDN